MLTDNFPVQFRYISKRLVTDIVKQWAAGRSEIRVGNIGASFGILQASIKVAEIDWSNEYQLVNLANFAVRDHTGWLDAGDCRRRIPSGHYIRGRMPLQQNLVRVLGWGEPQAHAAAGFVGWERLPGFGRVFVGMIGSQANLHGVQVPSRLTRAGRTASDMVGLYELINATREANDPRLENHFLELEHEYVSNAAEMLREAAGSFEGTSMLGQSELVEFLLLPHAHAVDIDLQLDDQSTGTFELALLGAPIWVATPPPEADQRLLPDGRRAYHRMASGQDNTERYRQISVARTGQDDRGSIPVLAPGILGAHDWQLFDTWLSAYIDVWHGRQDTADLAGWPPRNDDWHSYCRWAVDLALRFANPPQPFVRPVVRRRAVGLKKAIEWSTDREAGWLTSPRYESTYSPAQRRTTFMLLTTAAVYQCDLHGHCVGETPVPVAEVSTGTAAAALLRSAARWMTPFSPHEWTDPVIGDTGHLSGVRSPGNWVR